MQPNLWHLYHLMLRSRLFEEMVTTLWNNGLISGEMHLGTGEEGLVAAVMDQLQNGDAMALDHRGTPPLIMRGVDPVLILREFLGHAEGLCSGMGGHMHMFAPDHLAASSGIVGASGPAAVGFALAGSYLRPGTISIAFFGEAAMNQGMLLEALNLAAVWELPMLFMCKDNGWGITTDSETTTKGDLLDRARGFDIPGLAVDGSDVIAVWYAVQQALTHIRASKGPFFIHGRCIHLQNHFLGYQPLRIARQTAKEMRPMIVPMSKAVLSRGGAKRLERISNVILILKLVIASYKEHNAQDADPLHKAFLQLERTNPARLDALEATVLQEMEGVLNAATLETA